MRLSSFSSPMRLFFAPVATITVDVMYSPSSVITTFSSPASLTSNTLAKEISQPKFPACSIIVLTRVKPSTSTTPL